MKPNFMLDGVAMTTKFQHFSEVKKETVNIISDGSYTYSAINYYYLNKNGVIFYYVNPLKGVTGYVR